MSLDPKLVLSSSPSLLLSSEVATSAALAPPPTHFFSLLPFLPLSLLFKRQGLAVLPREASCVYCWNQTDFGNMCRQLKVQGKFSDRGAKPVCANDLCSSSWLLLHPSSSPTMCTQRFTAASATYVLVTLTSCAYGSWVCVSISMSFLS